MGNEWRVGANLVFALIIDMNRIREITKIAPTDEHFGDLIEGSRGLDISHLDNKRCRRLISCQGFRGVPYLLKSPNVWGI